MKLKVKKDGEFQEVVFKGLKGDPGLPGDTVQQEILDNIDSRLVECLNNTNTRLLVSTNSLVGETTIVKNQPNVYGSYGNI